MKTKLISEDQLFMVLLEKDKKYNQVNFSIYRTMQMDENDLPITFEGKEGFQKEKFEDQLTKDDALMSGWYQPDLCMQVNFRKSTVFFSRPEEFEELTNFLKDVESKLAKGLIPDYKPVI